ncbi:MAG: hypothetical protein ACTSR3_22880 [Candidatus Helarchaeota archaeon]
MKREIEISEVLDEVIKSYITSHSKFNNLSEFAAAAFRYYIENEEILRTNILILDKSD